MSAPLRREAVPPKPFHDPWGTAHGIRHPVLLASHGTPPAILAGDPEAPLPYGAVQVGLLPPLYPEWLGDRAFLAAHDVRFAYVAGEMARGIATVEMVVAMARAGMLGFFGAAGLPPHQVADALAALATVLDPPSLPWGVNLIHSPDAQGLEDALVDTFLSVGVRRVCASAFLQLSPAAVRYAASGLARGPDGAPVRRNRLFAKISRPEVAAHFLSPPPERMLRELVAAGRLTGEEAAIASTLPLAEDITAEADSAGHTDNRPLTVLLPEIAALRDRIASERGYAVPPRIGAAGGLGTPAAVAAAFALGAAYVVTASINQAAAESGLSPAARAMLHDVTASDVAMAPSADMFELGVKVQVLRKGTFFAPRAARLYEAYRAYGGLEELPPTLAATLERDLFCRPLNEVWAETERFFAARDPRELERAAREPKHRMALVFRWYLGMSSRWPVDGAADRQADFQIWCGPSMGAFNGWTVGSFLAQPENRTVVQIALNLMEGAAVVTRAQQLRAAGVDVPAEAFQPRPRRLAVGTP